MISRRKESTRSESENRVNIGRAFACPSRILDIGYIFPYISFLYAHSSTYLCLISNSTPYIYI
jgi:hypothetical protein